MDEYLYDIITIATNELHSKISDLYNKLQQCNITRWDVISGETFYDAESKALIDGEIVLDPIHIKKGVTIGGVTGIMLTND